MLLVRLVGMFTRRAELIAALTLLLVLAVTPYAFGGVAADSPARALAAASSARGPVAVPGTLRWPTASQRPRVVQPFRAPTQAWTAGHRGVDLAVATGTPVLAPAAGVVSFAGTVVDRGVVTISHDTAGGALRSSLEPVQATVRTGDVVARGQPIGVVAAGGAAHCARNCLHWGLRHERQYLDPAAWVGPAPHPILLPLNE